MNLKAFLLIMVLMSGSVAVLAQGDDEPPARRGSRIINDTLKQIYGPRTSRYFHEKDVFYNREVFYQIDTLIANFHRFNYVQRNNNFHQDLGNIGTSIRPIYYQSPTIVGVNVGFQTYDMYWDSEEIKYYDTKSPFTNIKVDLGARGRSITRATFSRNITPNWNFGFTYRGIFIDKQIQRRGKGDRAARGNYYDIYTTYQTKDSTYRLFTNFRRMFHEVDEFGGVRTGTSFTLADFFIDEVQPWLTEANSNDLRNSFHLYHHYKVGKALQVYHQLDQYRQANEFIDKFASEPAAYFDRPLIDSALNLDATQFKTLRNEVGMKGSLLKLFYNGYYALRSYDMRYNYIPNADTINARLKGTESYLGGRISLKLDSLVEVNGLLEIQQEGNFRVEGEIRSKWFEASLKQTLYEPTYVQQAYRGGHDEWNNNFDKVESTWLNGYLHYRSKWLNFSPGVTLTRIRNYVYFRSTGSQQTASAPTQSDGNQIYVSPEAKFSIRFLRHVTFSGQAIYTKFLENTGDAIRLPDLFVNSQLAYANIFFNGNLDMQVGVDLHWKSAYYALGYDPVIRQFYTQDAFKVPEFPVMDIFFNAKIKRGRIFLKYHNFVQAFTDVGYLPTPYYPGQRSIVDFGFDWSFYD